MTSARRTLDLAMSEAQWQATVVDLATTFGWLTYHTYDSRRSLAGFPDLVLVRDRVIFAELKREREDPGVTQLQWLSALRDAGAEWYVWRPSDWPVVSRTLRERR